MNSLRYHDHLEDKIILLSRQLKTYLNYKESSIIAICSDSDNQVIPESPLIQRLETELRMHYFHYKNFFSANFKPSENYDVKFLILAKKALLYPSSIEARAFNGFLKSKIEMWKLIHALSELEIYNRPQLFKWLIINLIRFCDEESKINENVANFFHQLKLNYLQLERDYNQLILTRNNKPNKVKEINSIKNKETRVMIRE